MANLNQSDFWGIGVAFPLNGHGGSMDMAAGEDSIVQSMWAILATAPGERLMRPDFGCGIHNLVFSINDSTTIGLVCHEVRRSLVLWEPRIDVLEVTVEIKGKGEVLLINVGCRERTTNNFFNFVYPFYLSSESDS